MGGTALGRQANRLTLPQHKALAAFAKDQLAPFFPSIYTWRDLGDKESHGDLDLVCEWGTYDPNMKIKGYEEDLGMAHLKGEVVNGPRGLAIPLPPTPADERTSLASPPPPPPPLAEGTGTPKAEVPAKVVEKETEDNRKMRQWCVDICKAVRGQAWCRNGKRSPIISIGVPCKAFEFATEENKVRSEEDKMYGLEPFWQIDLVLLPPATGPFCLLTTSYGDTLIILSIAVKIISSSLNLQMTNLTFRHSPFVGMPPIKFEMTSDPRRLCDWIGLDYAAWLDARFEHVPELWEWLTRVKEDSLLGRVWTKMANRVKEDDLIHRDEDGKPLIKNHKRKVPGLEDFLVWLRRPDSPWRSKEGTTPRSSDTPPVQDLDSSSGAGSLSSITAVHDIPDPENPTPVDPRGQDALTFWGAQKTFDEQMVDRRAKAAYMAERRKACLASKAAHEEAALKRAEEGMQHLKLEDAESSQQ